MGKYEGLLCKKAFFTLIKPYKAVAQNLIE